MPWKSSQGLLWLAQGISYISSESADSMLGDEIFRVFLVIAAVWSAALIAACISVGLRFVNEQPQSEMLLRGLRSLGLLTVSVMFQPFTSVLLQAVSCPNPQNWLGTTMRCSDPPRLLLLGSFIMLLIAFSVVAFFVAATFVDRDPSSPSWASKTDGRIEVFLLFAKLVLAFVYSVFPDAVGTAPLIVLLVLVGAMWYSAVFRTLPYAWPHVNASIGAIAAGLMFWPALALATAQLLPEQDHTMMVIFGIVTFASTGGLAIHAEQARVVNSPLSELRTLAHVAAWARHRVREAVGTSRARARPITSVQVGAELPLDGSAAAEIEVGERSMVAEMHTEDPTRTVAATLKEQLLSEASFAYETAARRFSQSADAHIIASIFEQKFGRFRVREAAALSKAAKLSPSLDARFYLFLRSKTMSAGAAALNPVERLLFEQQWNEVRTIRISVFRSVQRLWEGLAELRPSLEALQESAMEVDMGLTRIEELFSRLLAATPDSPSLLRTVAEHALEQNEIARAQELLNRADRVQDRFGRQQNGSVSKNLLLFSGTNVSPDIVAASRSDESAATITVSVGEASIGEILFVSSGATRLLSFTSQQLIGQNIAAIVPPPFRASHTAMMRRFFAPGSSSTMRGSRVIGRRNVSFVVDGTGAILPVWMSIIEAPPDSETFEPRLSALLEKIDSRDSFILLGGADDCSLLGADSHSCHLLGLDPQVLSGGAEAGIKLSQWLPSLEADFSGVDIRLTPAHRQFLRRGSITEFVSPQATAGIRTNVSGLVHANLGGGMHRVGPGRPKESHGKPGALRPGKAMIQASSRSLIGRVSQSSRNIPDSTRRLRRGSLASVPGEISMEPIRKSRTDGDHDRHMPRIQDDGSLQVFVPPLLEALDSGEAVVVPVEDPTSGELTLILARLQTVKAGGERVIQIRWRLIEAGVSADKIGWQLSRAFQEIGMPGTLSQSSSRAIMLRMDADAKSVLSDVASLGSRSEDDERIREELSLRPPSPGVHPPPRGEVPIPSKFNLLDDLLDVSSVSAASPGPTGAMVVRANSPITAEAVAQALPSPKVHAVLLRSQSSKEEGTPTQKSPTRSAVAARFSKAGNAVRVVTRLSHNATHANLMSQAKEEDALQEKIRMKQQGNATGDGSSVGSAGSVAMMNSLMRALKAMRKQTEPEVRAIRFLIGALMLLLFCGGLLSVVWLSFVNNDLASLQEGLRLASIRVEAVQLGFQYAVDAARNASGAKSAYSVRHGDMLPQIAARAEQLREINEQLMSKGDAGGMLGRKYDAECQVRLVVPGSPPRVVRLGEAVRFTQANLFMLGQQPSYEDAAASFEFRALQWNIAAILVALEGSISWRTADLQNAAPVYQYQVTGIGVFFFVFATGSSFLVISASVRSLWKRTEGTLGLLLAVPRKAARALAGRSAARLERLMAQVNKEAGAAQGLEEDEQAEQDLVIQETDAEDAFDKAVKQIAKAESQKSAAAWRLKEFGQGDAEGVSLPSPAVLAASRRMLSPTAGRGGAKDPSVRGRSMRFPRPNPIGKTSPTLEAKAAPAGVKLVRMETKDMLELHRMAGTPEGSKAAAFAAQQRLMRNDSKDNVAGLAAKFMASTRSFDGTLGRDSWKKTCILLGPVFLILIWVLFCVLYLRTAHQIAEHGAHRSVNSGLGAFSINRLVSLSTDLLNSPPPNASALDPLSFGVLPDQVNSTELASRIILLERSVEHISRIISLGGGSVFPRSSVMVTLPPWIQESGRIAGAMNSEAFRGWTESACGLIRDTTCSTVEKGILMDGVLSALSSFGALAREFVGRMVPTLSEAQLADVLAEYGDLITGRTLPGTAHQNLLSMGLGPASRALGATTPSHQELVSMGLGSQRHLPAVPTTSQELLGRLADLENPHLLKLLLTTRDILVKASTESLWDSQVVVSAVSWSFIGCFAMMLPFFYGRALRKLPQSLRASHSVLQLIPSELVQVLPQVREELRSIVTRAAFADRLTGVAIPPTPKRSNKPSNRRRCCRCTCCSCCGN
jgi:hypothetical protein